MKILGLILLAALTFGVCFLFDKGFTGVFRSKAQHKSGMAVRVNKRYAAFGVIMIALGVAAVLAGLSDSTVLVVGGIIVGVIGICLTVYYVTFGIYYDHDSFILSTFSKRSLTYQYNQIRSQQLYNVSGNTIIELHMTDGKNISLQAAMPGVYDFLDTAFHGWCRQKGIDSATCSHYDPDNTCWFPPMEEA